MHPKSLGLAHARDFPTQGQNTEDPVLSRNLAAWKQRT
jgi:hypothetical protein